MSFIYCCVRPACRSFALSCRECVEYSLFFLGWGWGRATVRCFIHCCYIIASLPPIPLVPFMPSPCYCVQEWEIRRVEFRSVFPTYCICILGEKNQLIGYVKVLWKNTPVPNNCDKKEKMDIDYGYWG